MHPRSYAKMLSQKLSTIPQGSGLRIDLQAASKTYTLHH